MKKLTRLFHVGLLGAISPFIISVALAGETSPVELIKSRNEAVEKALNDAGEHVSETTKEALKDIINGVIDFWELSRRALGKHWKERSEKEQGDFVSVFQKLIRNSSVKKLEAYKADRIEYEEPEIDGEKAKINTIAYKDKKQIEVLYKMHKVGDEWKVVDMEIDGASTARNYRESFYRQIAKTSYQQMYDKLLKRLGDS